MNTRFSHLTIIIALSVFLPARASSIIDDFEDGDLAGWTINDISGPTPSWSNHTSTPPGAAPSRVLVSYDTSNNDSPIGTALSPAFTIDENTLEFTMNGHGGTGSGSPSGDPANNEFSDMGNTWILRRTSDNATLVRGTAPFENSGGNFRTYRIDTSDYIGTEVELLFSDGRSDGFGWMAVDNIQTVGRDATSVFTLEIGDDQSSWSLSGGSSFLFNVAQVSAFGAGNFHPREGGEFLRSQDSGTGTATSPNFLITRENLEFYTGGFGLSDPGSGSSTVELRLASDNSVLNTWGDDEVLGGDSWQLQTLDVTAYAGDEVYLVLNDNVNGGYGWAGIDDVIMTGDTTYIPEPSTMAMLMIGMGLLAVAMRKRVQV